MADVNQGSQGNNPSNQGNNPGNQANPGNQGNNPGNQGNNPGNQGNNPGQSIESRQSSAGQAGGQHRMEPFRDRFASSRPGSPFSLMRRWMNDMDRWFGDFGGTSLLPRFDELLG